jgi:hypothetical protein
MLKVINSLVCDDIRVENNGKLILIGVYGGNLYAPQPVEQNRGLTLNLWMEIETEPDRPLNMESRAIIEDLAQAPSNVVFSFEFELAATPELAHQVSFQFPVRLDFTHTLRLELKAGAGDWQFLRRIKINSSSTPPSVALKVDQVDRTST